MDRKYGHRGYRDAERQDKHEKRDNQDRKPPQGGPRGATDHLGPRTPRMVGTVHAGALLQLRRGAGRRIRRERHLPEVRI